MSSVAVGGVEKAPDGVVVGGGVGRSGGERRCGVWRGASRWIDWGG